MDEEEGRRGRYLRWDERERSGIREKELGVRRQNEQRPSHCIKLNMVKQVLLQEQMVCCCIIKLYSSLLSEETKTNWLIKTIAYFLCSAF